MSSDLLSGPLDCPAPRRDVDGDDALPSPRGPRQGRQRPPSAGSTVALGRLPRLGIARPCAFFSSARTIYEQPGSSCKRQRTKPKHALDIDVRAISRGEGLPAPTVFGAICRSHEFVHWEPAAALLGAEDERTAWADSESCLPQWWCTACLLQTWISCCPHGEFGLLFRPSLRSPPRPAAFV